MIEKLDQEKEDPVDILGMELIEINIKMAKMNEVILSCYQMLKNQREPNFGSQRSGSFKLTGMKSKEDSKSSDEDLSVPRFGVSLDKIDEEEFEANQRTPRDSGYYQMQRHSTEDRADEYDQWLKANVKSKGKKGNLKEAIKNKDKFLNKIESENQTRKSVFNKDGNNERIQNFSDFFEQRSGEQKESSTSKQDE